MMDELGFLECSSSALSLLPRTLGFFSSETGAAPFEQQDYAIESFFKTVASNHSKDCLEQAKVILNGSTALPIMFPGNGETGSVKNGEDHPQERRPALGRKRARFSMMPSTSPSLGNLDFEKLDMKSSTLTDPEEFFSYQEKLENADREVKKLLGRGAVSTDLTQQHQTATRQRRLGILGKTAKYKPPVLLHADDVEIVVLSQEKVIEKGASIPCKIAIDTEPHNFSYLSNQSDISHELGTVTRSVADGDKGENLLDTLLSSMKGLDEDEEVAFLQKRLQFKPVIVDKLRLPELNRDQRDDVGGVKRKGIVQKVGGSLFSYSPTLSRKPLATISLLQRHFSQGDPPQDPHACAGDFSLIEGRDENSLSPAANVNQPDTRILNSEGDTTLVKKNGRRSNSMEKWPSSITEPNKTAHSRIVMEEMLTRDSPCSLDLKTDHNPIRFDSNNHVSSPGSDGCSEDKVNEMLQEAPTSQAQDGLEDQLSPVAGTNLPMDARSEKFSTSPEQHDELIPVVGTNLPMDARSEKFSTSPEQHDEELQRDSGVSMITQLQPKAPRNKQRPNIRRKSLTEAGTRWEAGVRRSTRIKTRPLEHWRGEKLLYGRIHDSLTTVIGIKYASPCKGGGTQVLKVKSYVPEKYAELVEQAAMH